VTERTAVLETKMQFVLEQLAEIRATQLEIRDTQLKDKAEVGGGVKVLQILYPPLSAVAVWIVAQFGGYVLPR
jgi:hypothetical protein